jgi:hypothetical protein
MCTLIAFVRCVHQAYSLAWPLTVIFISSTHPSTHSLTHLPTHHTHVLSQSYVTLFTLMVVNDWNNTMAGHTATAGTLSRAFFMCFYMFTVLIVVNVILACV